jgi:pimeloyl-ACP methyl ester carboxylesterase
MQPGEVQAFGELGGKAIAHPARTARDVHRAVAARVFGTLGAMAAPVRVMHDGIAAAAYTATGAALQGPARAAASAIAGARTADGALADTPAGSFLLGALNGAAGDALVRDHPALALDMEIRRRGRTVSPDSEGLATAFPGATRRLAVFVHGLGENDASWRGSYGRQLRADLGFTPLHLRYNTGLHISDNGRRLAKLLEHVVAAWPVEVDRLALVGHSMGGLVARSACHYGERDDHDWTGRLTHVVCLGTPHLGAPLERAANAAGWALGRLPETRPFADAVNLRSSGIKDLRYGSCVEEDWCDCDADELLRDRCTDVPFLPSATYCFVGATLTQDPDSRLGSVVGDLLVQYVSASGNGRKRRIPFEADNGRHLGGLNHFQLLDHPAVYEQLREWLARM